MNNNKSPYRHRAHEILAVASNGDAASRLFDVFLLVLITLNLLAVIAESVQTLQSAYATWFRAFEVFSVGAFTLEYLLRIWSCVEDPRYQAALRGRARFAVTPLAVVDLIAILPFYLAFISVDLRMLRVLRIFRLIRVAKIVRYSNTLRLFSRVLVSVKSELLFTLFLMTVLLILSSCLMYFAENADQPEAFSSIPAAMWWSIATLTTVGYGDVYPITGFGKLLASMIAIFGIGMFALPTGVLGAAFLEEIRKEKSEHTTCPHCGRAQVDKEDTPK
jgi:voltage-gated potassium channel